jgi:hypothetical protein
MGTNEKIIAQLIASHKRAIRILLASAIVLFVLGLIVIVMSARLGQIADLTSGWIKIMGLLTSSLGALPLKELLDRQEKSERALILQARYKLINENPKAVGEEERKRIIQLMTSYVDKFLVS